MTVIRKPQLLLTNEQSKANILQEKLRQIGIMSSVLPCIKVRSFTREEASLATIEPLENYDWLLFTSQNAILAFVELFQQQLPLSKHLHIAVVGKSTQKLAEQYFSKVDFIPPDFHRASLLQYWKPGEGAKILFPHGNQTPSLQPQDFLDPNVNITSLLLYSTTILQPNMESIEELARREGVKQWTHIAFLSPSAVQGFFTSEAYPCYFGTRAFEILAIGPTTAQAISSFTKQEVTVLTPHSHEGFLNYFAKS